MIMVNFTNGVAVDFAAVYTGLTKGEVLKLQEKYN